MGVSGTERLGAARFVALGVLVASAACAPAAAPSADTVPLRIVGTPADATVTIDDQRVGSLALVAARGIRVLPGRHRITVEAMGYLPFDLAIEARNRVVTVPVSLVPVPGYSSSSN
jgi:PEGA domain